MGMFGAIASFPVRKEPIPPAMRRRRSLRRVARFRRAHLRQCAFDERAQAFHFQDAGAQIGRDREPGLGGAGAQLHDFGAAQPQGDAILPRAWLLRR